MTKPPRVALCHETQSPVMKQTPHPAHPLPPSFLSSPVTVSVCWHISLAKNGQMVELHLYTRICFFIFMFASFIFISFRYRQAC